MPLAKSSPVLLTVADGRLGRRPQLTSRKKNRIGQTAGRVQCPANAFTRERLDVTGRVSYAVDPLTDRIDH